MRIQLMLFLRGMQGALDDLVYKRFEGRMIAAVKPEPFAGPPSAAQIAQRGRFKEASSYARNVYGDPLRKAVYETAAKAAGRQSVFALIMGDRLSPPKVTELDLTGYGGAIGNEILVKAVDDFEVVSVHVTIRDANGDPLGQLHRRVLSPAAFENPAEPPAQLAQRERFVLTAKARAAERRMKAQDRSS